MYWCLFLEHRHINQICKTSYFSLCIIGTIRSLLKVHV